MPDKQLFDISKRQKYAFEAAVENSKIANQSVTNSQNWILVLGTTELVFLGSLLVMDEIADNHQCLVRFLIILILLSFLMFIWGSRSQFKYVVRKARMYESISTTAINKYLNKGIYEVDKIPKDLKFSDKQIISDKASNILMFSSLITITAVTIGIAVLLAFG